MELAFLRILRPRCLSNNPTRVRRMVARAELNAARRAEHEIKVCRSSGRNRYAAGAFDDRARTRLGAGPVECRNVREDCRTCSE